MNSLRCLHGPNAHAKRAGGSKVNDEWESAELSAFPPALNFALAEACVGLARGHDPAIPARSSSRLSRPYIPSVDASESLVVPADVPAPLPAPD